MDFRGSDPQARAVLLCGAFDTMQKLRQRNLPVWVSKCNASPSV